MPAETPMHHSAAKTASAARSFRIEVPPLGFRINYGQAGDRFRSPPSVLPASFSETRWSALTSPHAVTVSTAEHSNEVWDLIVGGENLNERAGRHPAHQRCFNASFPAGRNIASLYTSLRRQRPAWAPRSR
jgi:hypothetical protein